MRTKPFIFTILVVGLLVSTTRAHPLGNFSVNQYSGIEVGKGQIRLREVLDLAEIPTFQESSVIDTDRDGKLSQQELDAYAAQLTPGYEANLRLTANDAVLAIRSISSKAVLGVGAADL